MCTISDRVLAMRSLIEAQLEVLLERDPLGRLIATRDPLARPAPRLFLGRSGERNVWAVRHDVDEATRVELNRLCGAEPTIETPSAESAPACRELAIDRLDPIDFEWRGPAYVLPNDLPQDSRARVVRADESDTWIDSFPWLEESFEALAPVVIAFEAGQAAAVCHSPRGWTDHAAEAGVETLESFRRMGLAAAAVACWASAVQRTGRLALYSTSWDNRSSLAVARRLSARLYGEDWHLY
jgi:hypothetical protein